MQVRVLYVCGFFLTIQTFCCMLAVNFEDLIELFEHSWNFFAFVFYFLKQLNQVLHGILLAFAYTKLFWPQFLQILDGNVFGLSFSRQFRKQYSQLVQKQLLALDTLAVVVEQSMEFFSEKETLNDRDDVAL